MLVRLTDGGGAVDAASKVNPTSAATPVSDAPAATTSTSYDTADAGAVNRADERAEQLERRARSASGSTNTAVNADASSLDKVDAKQLAASQASLEAKIAAEQAKVHNLDAATIARLRQTGEGEALNDPARQRREIATRLKAEYFSTNGYYVDGGSVYAARYDKGTDTLTLNRDAVKAQLSDGTSAIVDVTKQVRGDRTSTTKLTASGSVPRASARMETMTIDADAAGRVTRTIIDTRAATRGGIRESHAEARFDTSGRPLSERITTSISGDDTSSTSLTERTYTRGVVDHQVTTTQTSTHEDGRSTRESTVDETSFRDGVPASRKVTTRFNDGRGGNATDQTTDFSYDAAGQVNRMHSVEELRSTAPGSHTSARQKTETTIDRNGRPIFDTSGKLLADARQTIVVDRQMTSIDAEGGFDKAHAATITDTYHATASGTTSSFASGASRLRWSPMVSIIDRTGNDGAHHIVKTTYQMSADGKVISEGTSHAEGTGRATHMVSDGNAPVHETLRDDRDPGTHLWDFWSDGGGKVVAMVAGTGLTLAGGVLSLTGIGAPAGIGMAAAGIGIATGAVDVFGLVTNRRGVNLSDVVMDIPNIVIPVGGLAVKASAAAGNLALATNLARGLKVGGQALAIGGLGLQGANVGARLVNGEEVTALDWFMLAANGIGVAGMLKPGALSGLVSSRQGQAPALPTAGEATRAASRTGQPVVVDGNNSPSLRFSDMVEYSKVPVPVRAEPLTKPTTITTKSGRTMTGNVGDLLVTDASDSRIVAADIFSKTYKPLGDGTFVKVASVFAVKMPADFTVLTREGPQLGVAGDYLVQGPAGEAWPITAATFEATYRLISGSVGTGGR